jgi:methylthioribose-1-phosphate isomerase
MRAIEWTGSSLRVLDQTRLPWSEATLEADSVDAVVDAIKRMAVRGAPLAGLAIAPPGTPVANPAFDVTPADLLTAIVTDRGVALPPLPATLAALAREPQPAIDDPTLQEVPS